MQWTGFIGDNWEKSEEWLFSHWVTGSFRFLKHLLEGTKIKINVTLEKNHFPSRIIQYAATCTKWIGFVLGDIWVCQLLDSGHLESLHNLWKP